MMFLFKNLAEISREPWIRARIAAFSGTLGYKIPKSEELPLGFMPPTQSCQQLYMYLSANTDLRFAYFMYMLRISQSHHALSNMFKAIVHLSCGTKMGHVFFILNFVVKENPMIIIAPDIAEEYSRLIKGFKVVNEAGISVSQFPFLKIIKGSNYADFNRQFYWKLTYIAAKFAERSNPIFKNYRGGITDDDTKGKLDNLIQDADRIRERIAGGDVALTNARDTLVASTCPVMVMGTSLPALDDADEFPTNHAHCKNKTLIF